MIQRFLLCFTLIILGSFGLLAQEQFQGFEGTANDNWNFTVNPPAYNVPAEADVWDDTTAVEISPLSGDFFWFMRDLDNPSGGTEGFHTMDFDLVDISAFSFNLLTFNYYTEGFDASDSLGYILYFDNGTTWDMADYVALSPNTQGWELVVINIPDNSDFVRLRLMAKQNGASDWAGLDDIRLQSSNSDGFPPLVQSVEVISPSQLQVAFSEPMGSTAEIVTNYTGINNLATANLNATLDTVILSYGSNFTNGLEQTLTISNVQDVSGNAIDPPFEFSFIYNGAVPNLVITEIMYNDTSTNDNLEFIEIYNAGTDAALGGLTIEGEFNFTFPVMNIAPGEVILLAREESIAEDFYGVDFMDWGTGGLNNGGGPLVILNTEGDIIDFVDFDDATPWPTEPDGEGPSLELISYTLNNMLGENWRANLTQVGTTGIFANPGVVSNDITPIISFANESTLVDEANDAFVEVSITNSGDIPATFTVEIAAASTAIQGEDHDYAGIVYNVPANTIENIIIEVPVIDDALEDGGRYLILEITGTVDGELGSITRHNVLIADNDAVIPEAQASPDVQLSHLGSYKVGGSDGVSEIVAHDPLTNRLFVTNSEAVTLEIINYEDPTFPFMFTSIELADFDAGEVTSVAFNAGTVAVAVPGEDVEENGRVLFFDVVGNLLNEVEVGNLPDMLAFTPDGTKILTANEGEPNDDYDVDPVGSISIIDLSVGVPNLSQDDVTTLEYSVFDGEQAALEAAGVRIFGPGATVGQDLEPEFIAISEDGTTAYVTLQENNAVGIIDLVNNELTDVLSLGYKDHSLLANQLDASNTAPGIFSAPWNINGMYQPDALDYFTAGGQGYLVTVNEGDARDYDGFSEEVRVGDEEYVLDPVAFPFAEYIKADDLLGRLNVTLATGDIDNDGDYDEIYAYGARSMTIWNATTGELVWDSGDDFEQITANDPVFGALFNVSNSNNTFKNRSDDKGPEPEGVVVANINGQPIAFVGLERIGGLLVYNLSNPEAPEFIQYINTREVDEEGGDLGPEGIIYIEPADSPTGNGLVVVANEVSGTLSSFEVLTGPTAGFTEEAIAVSETVGTAQIEVTVETAGGIDGTFIASVNPASTAIEGVDFLFVSNPVTIPAGSTDPVNVEIDILDNADETGGKYLILDISSAGNVTPANEEQIVVLIQDDDKMAPTPNLEGYVQLNYLTSYEVDTDGGSAEILAYDPNSQRLFVVNSEKEEVEIVDFADPANPVELSIIDLAGFGNGVQSLDVRDDVVAVAVSGPAVDLPGRVVFFNTDGILINQVDVGVLPDMLTFTPDGTKIITANEGEPDDDYVVDPEGSVSIIDLTPGIANLTNADVTNVTFESFNSQINDLQAAGVRIYGPNATVAQDLEPEYIVVSNDGTTAYAFLQENNAAAVIDIATATVSAIIPLGLKDWSLEPNTIDVSNEAPGIFFANWPIFGMYQPDAVDYFEVNGQGYLISANEGDARDYDGYSEEARIKDEEYPLDPDVFPFAEELKNDNLLGRMKTTLANGDIDMDGDYDQIYTYGARSITIWDAATGALLWDSGDELERITAADPVYGALFNANNDENELKNRSDDKGPEPEAVVVAEVDGQLFSFVGLERTGGIVSYDINDPLVPEFIQYINTRDVNEEGGDLGPEDIKHIPFDQSPNGKHLLVVANEISSTVSIFEMELNCPVELGMNVQACEGETVTLNAEGNYTSYTWNTGEETASINVTIGDTYFVDVVTESGCTATDTIEVVFNELPIFSLGVDTTVCEEDLPYILEAGMGASYLWSDGSMGQTLEVSEAGTYSVTVTNDAGCEAVDEIEVMTTPCLSVADLFAGVVAELQPNPARAGTNLVLEQIETGIYELEVVDALGRVVYQTSLNVLGTTHQHYITTANLPSGMYQVRLVNGQAQMTRPLSVK